MPDVALLVVVLTPVIAFVAIFLVLRSLALRLSVGRLRLSHLLLARGWLLLLLRTLAASIALLARWRRAGMLEILLPWTSLRRRSRLSRRGRSLRPLLAIMLANYGVARLVTVVLALQVMLLFHSGIPIP